MSAPKLKLRQALPEEAAALTDITYEAKRHWGYPEHWIKFWETDLTISPEYIQNHHVVVAEVEEEIVGFYALTVNAKKSELDHMWVVPKQMGNGVGKALFIHAMQGASQFGIDEVQISSDPNAEGFYAKMGAYRIGETVSEVDGQARVLPLMTVKPTR